MGFIKKFILPREVDFDTALQTQSQATLLIITDLQKVYVENDSVALADIVRIAEQAKALKSKNMKELLDVFITPYDKESIYRIVTQLDWIVLSVKHFHLEAEIYEIDSLRDYQHIFQALKEMMTLLDAGILQVSSKQIKTTTTTIELIYEKYDDVVGFCTRASADLLQQAEFTQIFKHKDLLSQLREIAKRIHITANTLEDMAIKIV